MENIGVSRLQGSLQEQVPRVHGNQIYSSSFVHQRKPRGPNRSHKFELDQVPLLFEIELDLHAHRAE